MNINEIIAKKRDGFSLSKEEIEFFIYSVTNHTVPDYQSSALLMAIYLNSMNDEEIFYLTESMANSGDTLNLDVLGDKTVDKHSTGGVGDKTTLICGPMAAAMGCTVAKMSGRGLGHTGGTVDKLESIKGYNTDLSKDDFFRISKKCGICLMGHSGNFVPADSILYSLRDVTSTVDSIPLIASSIMSKKIAAGAKNILLDVKIGSGAFMKNIEDAQSLAKTMVKIGEFYNRNTAAIITDMSLPLGRAIGNELEVIEAIDVLNGKGEERLTMLCITLAANMYSLCFGVDIDTATKKAKSVIEDKSALNKLYELVVSQGGDGDLILGKKHFTSNIKDKALYAITDGYVTKTDGYLIGLAACEAGAGRKTKDTQIDHSAGIFLNKIYGEKVNKGDLLATVYAEEDKIDSAFKLLEKGYKVGTSKPKEKELIYKTIRNE